MIGCGSVFKIKSAINTQVTPGNLSISVAATGRPINMAEPKSYSTTRFSLNSGTSMPAIGMGTYRVRKNEVLNQTIDYALQAGYRMFDTAAVYGNEAILGRALKSLLPKYELEREDIFITTKLAPQDYGSFDVVSKQYAKSVKNLGMDYVDLYLIHFPRNSPEERRETWRSMQTLYDNGQVMAIGVSNFTVRHLEDLMREHSIEPAVNQVEWHPYYHQQELLDYCKGSDIVLQAYCSLGGTSSYNMSLMQDPVVNKIAKKLGVTPSQVLLTWALQQDVAVIPKASSPEHIQENISLDIRISDEDMKLLSALGEHNTKYTWDPSTVP